MNEDIVSVTIPYTTDLVKTDPTVLEYLSSDLLYAPGNGNNLSQKELKYEKRLISQLGI